MNLIIISGAEATGKSAIGKYIANELGYVYTSKDTIKERMFDTEKRSTWNYSWYEQRAKEEFFKLIEGIVRDHTNLVVDSNFVLKDKEELRRILDDSVKIIEIHCYTRGLVSFKRFVRRNESKARHPGHHDRRWYMPVLSNAILSNLKIRDAHKPVKLSDRILNIDTTNYATIYHSKILDFIASS